MYKVLALIGEAGAGKDTLMKTFIRNAPHFVFHEIVSCTTRPPRETEKNGVNYFFYSDEEIQKKIEKNEMLEYTFFNNWYYGTSYDSVVANEINIGVFNPAGIKSLLARNDVDLKIIYVRAGAKERLLRQLKRETDPDVDEIIRRYQADEVDFAPVRSKEAFEFEVLNNSNWNQAITQCRRWIYKNAEWLGVEAETVQFT